MSTVSVNRRRILSLWLPLLPTDRIRRRKLRLGTPLTQPLIVVGKQNNALHISARDEAAAQLGLAVGLPLANARAMCPDIAVEDADDESDRELLIGIADWCDRFTPLVGLALPHGLLLDITGCAHLFGGEAALQAIVSAALVAQGFKVQAAIAGTSACAQTLSRVSHGKVVRSGHEAHAIHALPVAALGADPAITRGLRRAGLNTIGDVAARAPHEIAARFGSAFTHLLDQAMGRADAPISPRKPVPDYVVEKRFAEPVATSDVIAATLQSLASVLVEAMERHGQGARQLIASFFRTDGVVRTIAVDAGQPVTRVDVVARLFAEKLDALNDPLDPGFGFDLIRLAALRMVATLPSQQGFDSTAHESDDVAGLADRLSARLGAQRVVRYLPIDTHIPERADLAVPMLHRPSPAADAAWPARIPDEPPSRPLRLFAQPEAIEVIFAEVPDKPPKHFNWRRMTHAIIRAEGPERIAMEWWRAAEHRPTRDYFRVEDQFGRRFWLYRDGLYGEILKEGEIVPPCWFIHGVFA